MDNNKFCTRRTAQVLSILLGILLILLILNQLKTLRTPAQTMNISAVGRTTAIPDLATATIGVISQGATPSEVKNNNTQKMNAITDFLKKQDIEAKDIVTSTFYTSPRYNYTNGQNTIAGYQADQTVTVTFRNVDQSQAQIEKVLDGVITQGANQIQGVTFSFSNIDKLKQQAIKQAIEKAKDKAEQLTMDAGLTLGNIKNVIETANDYPMPVMTNFAAKAAMPGRAAKIEPGSQEVTENITLVFEVY
jgi:uncharacterized protein YggE